MCELVVPLQAALYVRLYTTRYLSIIYVWLWLFRAGKVARLFACSRAVKRVRNVFVLMKYSLLNQTVNDKKHLDI